MSYKRKEGAIYNHYFYGNKIIIGLGKKLSESDISLICERPVERYNHVIYGKIMNLKLIHRTAIINSLERWNKTRCRKSSFIGSYWEVVLDFIFACFGKTEWDLTADMVNVDYFKNIAPEDVRKLIFDNIVKMKKNKGGIREQGGEIYKKICYYYRLSDDIVRTGQGLFFVCPNLELYTPEKVNEYCNKHKKIVLKDMVADITGTKKDDVKEIPIQIAFNQKPLDDKIYEFLNILIDELQKEEGK